MRKTAILVALLFLTACGSNSEEELAAFIESFNENEEQSTSAYVDSIQEEQVGEVKSGMQLLSENKNRYKIFAKYEDDRITGYQLEIHPENWHDPDSVAGFDAAEIIASTLELDKNQFGTEYSKAVIDREEYTYSENGYDISFFYDVTADGEFNEGRIDFDKTAE